MKATKNETSDIAEALSLDEGSGTGNRSRRWLVAALLLVGAASMAFVFRSCSGSPSTPHYKTREVQRGNLTVIVTATGTLEATNQVDVSSELSGIIKSIDVDYNSKVEAGQILAKLDTSKLEAQVTQSKATLESAKAKVLQARATVKETRSKLAQLKRVKELSNGKMPSQAEIDAAEAAFERALADVAGAKAAVSQCQAILEANETDLAKAAIRSPINGIVLKRKMEPGQTVAATLDPPVLFTLAEDLTKMKLIVNVDEADVGQIKEGQNATFSVAAYPNRTFEARIVQARYGSTTTSGVVTYETVLQVDNADLSLRPGMTATADIVIKRIEKALLIPNGALRFTPPVHQEKKASSGLVSSLLPHPPVPETQQPEATGSRKRQRVWTLRDGELLPIPVTIGSTSNGMAEVVAGEVQPGTAVVVDTISSGVLP
jgi:HlyD family secretion protein